VVLRGPNVDLSLSIKGRKFLNAAGKSNMPDAKSSPARSRIP